MSNAKEQAWIWQEAGDYDRWTAAEWSVYYEGYNALLELVCIRCRAEAGDSILDIGTGTGALAQRLVQNHGARVVGLDPSPGMIAEAQRKAAEGGWTNVTFEVAEAPFLKIPYPDGAFDAVVSSLAFHHIHETDKPAALAEMARVLRPGGHLVIGDSMFRNRADLVAALERWPEELEEEYFAYLETLPDMFAGAGLSFQARRISRINWVVWGQTRATSPPVDRGGA
jgi:ubiquinone/menaquinone biosynthesis C-methylase UbiE